MTCDARKALGMLGQVCGCAHRALHNAPFARCERIHPLTSSNCRRAIHRFDSANSVTICAVFFAKPR